MLSPLSRVLTSGVAALFALLGAVLFLAPDWAAANFLWRASPFVVMTAGGWYLGSAVMAWESARQWSWSISHPRLIFVWAFALLETGVLALHGAAIRWDAPLAWPYMATLAVAVVAAIVGIADWLRLRPAIEPLGVPMPGWARAGTLIYVIFLAVLAIGSIVAPPQALNGAIFPESLTPFSVRAFGAFYLALGIAATPLLVARGMAPLLAYGWGGYGLVVPILIAAFWHIDTFNFATRPLNWLYIGAYIAVTIGVIATMLWERGESERRAVATPRRVPATNA
jgi:hypothetical protein